MTRPRGGITIVLTAYAMETARVECLNAGCDEKRPSGPRHHIELGRRGAALRRKNAASAEHEGRRWPVMRCELRWGD